MTPVRNRAIVLVAALVWLAVFVVRPAQAWDPLQKARRAASAGQRALAAGDSAAALESMLRAQALAPRDRAIGAGLAETFYDTGEYESSIRQLEPLASDEVSARQRQRALYNAGNAAFRMQDLERALELYTDALVKGEGGADPDLLHNLELTQRLLQEQQEQQEQQGEDGEPQDQEQDQEQNQQQEQQPGDPQQQAPEQEQQQESGEQQQEQQQPQDQQTPPDEASEQDAQAAPPPVETMTPEEAMRLLQALDFDEEELRKSIQRRLRGDDEENEHDW